MPPKRMKLNNQKRTPRKQPAAQLMSGAENERSGDNCWHRSFLGAPLCGLAPFPLCQ
jgi:hypothetical protein